MTATGSDAVVRGAADQASADDDAGEAALPHLAADPVGRRCIGDRAGLDAVIDTLVAEIGADRDPREFAEQIGVLVLETLPFAARFAFAARCAELKPQPTDLGRSSARHRR